MRGGQKPLRCVSSGQTDLPVVSSRPSWRFPGVGLRRAGGGAGLGQAGAHGSGGRAGQVGEHPPVACRPRLSGPGREPGGRGRELLPSQLRCVCSLWWLWCWERVRLFFFKIWVAGREAASLLSSASGFASNLLYCVSRVSRWFYVKTALFTLFSSVPK